MPLESYIILPFSNYLVGHNFTLSKLSFVFFTIHLGCRIYAKQSRRLGISTTSLKHKNLYFCNYMEGCLIYAQE